MNRGPYQLARAASRLVHYNTRYMERQKAPPRSLGTLGGPARRVPRDQAEPPTHDEAAAKLRVLCPDHRDLIDAMATDYSKMLEITIEKDNNLAQCRVDLDTASSQRDVALRQVHWLRHEFDSIRRDLNNVLAENSRLKRQARVLQREMDEMRALSTRLKK